MATLTITIPDAVLGDVLDAFAERYRYDQARDGTKAQFARKKVNDHIKETYAWWKITEAKQSAEQAAAVAAAQATSGVSTT